MLTTVTGLKQYQRGSEIISGIEHSGLYDLGFIGGNKNVLYELVG